MEKSVDGWIFKWLKWKEQSRAVLIDQWVNQTCGKTTGTREISALNECCLGRQEKITADNRVIDRGLSSPWGFILFYFFLQFIGKRVLSHVRLLSSNSRFFSSLFCAWLLRSNEKSMTIYGLFSTRFPNMSQTVGRFFGVCHANTRPGRFLTNSPLIDSLGTFVELPFIGQLVKKIP